MWTAKRFFSPEQVEAAMTERGGFSRQPLAKLGVPWPPPKGWRKAITQHPVTCKEIVRRGRKWGATMPIYNSPYDNPEQRTPEEWAALIPKLGKWAFKNKGLRAMKVEK